MLAQKVGAYPSGDTFSREAWWSEPSAAVLCSFPARGILVEIGDDEMAAGEHPPRPPLLYVTCGLVATTLQMVPDSETEKAPT